MHKVQTADSERGRFVLGFAVLVALLALALLLREGPGHMNQGAPGAVAGSADLSKISAGDEARRAAIAALGPIKERPGTNAADLYRRALELYGGLTDKERSLLDSPNDKDDPAAAAALYARIQPIMDLLRSARKADYVDWEWHPTPPSNGLLIAVLNLMSLADWDAGYRFQSDPDGAVADLAAMVAVGRSEDDNMSGMIQGDGMQMDALNFIARNAGEISTAAGPDLAYIVSPSVVQQGFVSGLNGDAAALQAILDEYANPATQSQAVSRASLWFGLGESKNAASSPAALMAQVQWTIQMEQAGATALEEPDSQFQQWLSQESAGNTEAPVQSESLQLFAATRHVVQMIMVDDAMLMAGMALERNDQAQFQSIVDPVSGQPFMYTQTANGFQLSSTFLKRPGVPLTLSFSAPAAK